MTVGFFGIMDWTGLPAGLGTSVPHSAFRGAGRHFYHSIIVAELERKRIQDLIKRKALAKATNERVEKEAIHNKLQQQKMKHKRMVENASYTLLLAEI